MRKILAVSLLAAIVGFSGFQTADAGWGRGNRGAGPGACGSCEQRFSEEEQQARQDFLDETKDLRKQLFEKRNEYSEVVTRKDPDKEQAAAIWSEMFDLKSQIREKAEASGVPLGDARGRGRGTCDGSGDCYAWNDQGGQGRGYGPGCRGPRW